MSGAGTVVSFPVVGIVLPSRGARWDGVECSSGVPMQGSVNRLTRFAAGSTRRPPGRGRLYAARARKSPSSSVVHVYAAQESA